MVRPSLPQGQKLTVTATGSVGQSLAARWGFSYDSGVAPRPAIGKRDTPARPSRPEVRSRIMARSSEKAPTICIIMRPGRRGAIDVLGDREKAGAGQGDSFHAVQHVLQRSRQAIELPTHDGIACAQMVEHTGAVLRRTKPTVASPGTIPTPPARRAMCSASVICWAFAARLAPAINQNRPLTDTVNVRRAGQGRCATESNRAESLHSARIRLQ
jgi:hypothetical protein